MFTINIKICPVNILMWSRRPEQYLMSLGFCTVSTSATSERVTQLTFNCQLKLISAGLPVRSFCWVAQWLLHTDRKWCAAEGRLLQVMWPALHGTYRVLAYLWEITWGVRIWKCVLKRREHICSEARVLFPTESDSFFLFSFTLLYVCTDCN